MSDEVKEGQHRASSMAKGASRIKVHKDFGNGQYNVILGDRRVKTWLKATVLRRYPFVVEMPPAPAFERGEHPRAATLQDFQHGDMAELEAAVGRMEKSNNRAVKDWGEVLRDKLVRLGPVIEGKYTTQVLEVYHDMRHRYGMPGWHLDWRLCTLCKEMVHP